MMQLKTCDVQYLASSEHLYIWPYPARFIYWNEHDCRQCLVISCLWQHESEHELIT
jgi:hypothetical protein